MNGSEAPEEVLCYAETMGFNRLKVNKTHLLGRLIANKSYLLSDECYDEWIERLRKAKRKSSICVELPREKYINQGVLPCSAGVKTLYVSPTGLVRPCPFTKQFIFGNIRHSSLKDIIVKNRVFSVDNLHCLKCPAMKKSHGITNKQLI